MITLPEYGYSLNYSGKSRDTLVVALSHERFPMYTRLKFDGPFVCVWEHVPHEKVYYVRQAGAAVGQLATWLDAHDVNRVCFFGYSKGGYGALQWSGLLARLRPTVYVTAFAMSPQTRIYPRNVNIPQPSYRQMIDASETNGSLRSDLEAYGQLPDPFVLRNWHPAIVYPSRSRADTVEAEALGGGFDRFGLDLGNHNTLVPFMYDMGDIEQVRKAGASIMRSARVDPDAASVVKDAKLESLVAEYHALGSLPLIPEQTASLLAGGPMLRG